MITRTHFHRLGQSGFAWAIVAMVLVTAASNYLVQFPLNSWLTWGAFFYPSTFLVNELTNRTYGPRSARRVVYAGFVVGLVVSVLIAPARIATASAMAFLGAQLSDIAIFSRLRRRGAWWRAPLVSSVAASLLDTTVFFAVAFAGTDVPWWQLGVGDFCVKLALDLLMLGPFRAAIGRRQASPAPQHLQPA